MTKMRETTKKQLDLQEILFSKMVVRSEFVLQHHLAHAVQAAAASIRGQAYSMGQAIGASGAPDRCPTGTPI